MFCGGCCFEGLFVDRGQPDQSWPVTRRRYGALAPDFDEKETCSFEFLKPSFIGTSITSQLHCRRVHCSVSGLKIEENVRWRVDESRVFSSNFFCFSHILAVSRHVTHLKLECQRHRKSYTPCKNCVATGQIPNRNRLRSLSMQPPLSWFHFGHLRDFSRMLSLKAAVTVYSGI